jgi:hypothetical protein
VYLSGTFVFNPLTFRQDDVVHLPWSWYRTPLQVEYGVLEEEGWRFIRLSDVGEIRSVYAQLQKAAIARTKPDNPADNDQGKEVWFGIRRLSDGAVLLDAKGREGSKNYMLRGGVVAVNLTSELEHLLRERLRLARQAATEAVSPGP